MTYGFAAGKNKPIMISGYSLLWNAANNGDIELIRVILSTEGLARDTPGADGTAALEIAVGHRNYEIVDLLLNSPMIEHSSEDLIQMRDKLVDTPFYKPSINGGVLSSSRLSLKLPLYPKKSIFNRRNQYRYKGPLVFAL